MKLTHHAYAIVCTPTQHTEPLEVLGKVEPATEFKYDPLSLELYNCRCPGSPTSCTKWIDPAVIYDVE